jgi:hypothetical protein
LALHIIAPDNHGRPEISIALRIEEYEFLMERIESHGDFPLLNQVLADYYGQSELYIEQIPLLRQELVAFDQQFQNSYTKEMVEFVAELFELITQATVNRRTIRFDGD